MFDAIAARKFQFDRLIDGEKTRRREDLVTSSLFGAIRFLPSLARQRALQILVGAEVAGCDEVLLWPRFVLDGNTVEPDVVLRLNDGADWTFWIVEVKWGAPFQKDQIGRQIRAVQNCECRKGEIPGGPRRVTGYTLLGAEPKHAIELDSARRGFKDLLFRKIEWPALVKNLGRAGREQEQDSSFKAWAEAAAGFLRSTSMGQALGTWPKEITMPSPIRFPFSRDRAFSFGEGIGPVTSACFKFNERTI